MKFAISKLELFAPLQQVVGVVERKQTHEVMNNLLFVATDEIKNQDSADRIRVWSVDDPGTQVI